MRRRQSKVIVIPVFFWEALKKTTLKDLTEMLGKETVYLFNNSETKGNSPSYSYNQQKVAKELLSIDELSVIDGDKCILQVRGVRPFFSNKYDITKHKHYRFLSDASPKNKFNLEGHISRKLKVNPVEEYEFFEYIPVDEELPTEVLVDFTDLGYSDEDFMEDFEPI